MITTKQSTCYYHGFDRVMVLEHTFVARVFDHFLLMVKFVFTLTGFSIFHVGSSKHIQ